MITMNNNKIIRKSFWDKKAFVGICISIFLLFFSSFSLDSLNAQSAYHRKKTYGFHNGIAFDITEHAEEQLENHLSINEYGEMVVYGEIINENNVSVGTIGTVDEAFKQMEQLEFLDGTYPSNNNEIAIESSMLDLLSIPYDVGSGIEITIQNEEGVLLKQRYTISGILKSYTTNWLNCDHSICGAIVSKFDSTPIERTLFFVGDYANETQMQELKPLINDNNESELVYNTYSYVSNTFDFYDFFENGSLLIGVSVVCFLMLIYIEISSYQKQIYRNRVFLSLGMSQKNLKKQLYTEMIKQWFMSWLFVCGISTIIGLFLECFFDESMQFTLTYRPYLCSLFLSLFVVVVAQTIQYSILKNISIITNGKDISKYSIKHIKRNIELPFTNKSFIEIEKKRTQKQRILNALLSICTLIILFCGMYNISTTYQEYKWNQKNLGYAYKWETSSSKNGLTKEQIVQIKNTEGIQSVKYCSKVSYIGTDTNLIYLNYENQKNDEYSDLYLKNKYLDNNVNDGLPIELVVLPENSNIWNDITDLDDKTTFLNGESVICYFMDLSEMSDGTVQTVDEDLKEDVNRSSISMKSGDDLSIQANNSIVHVKCEKIIHHLNTINVDTNITSGTLFISEKLYEKLLGLDTIVYNQVIAYGNKNISYDVTDKLMSMVNQNTTITFENRRIELEEEGSSSFFKITYISVFLLLVSLFVLVQLYRNQIHFYENEKERIYLLKQLGATSGTLKKIYQQNNIFKMIICFVILNICIVPIIWIIQFQQVSNYASEGLSFMRILKYGLIYTNIWILVIPQVLFILVYAFLMRKIHL